jgi:two-component system, NarL family, nitrate/nitrite response regulator NarL
MLMSCVRAILVEERKNTKAAPRNAAAPLREPSLSPREQEVAQWAAVGARNKEIAWTLGIAEGTVKLHLFHIYRKLNVNNRVGLAIALSEAAKTNGR